MDTEFENINLLCIEKFKLFCRRFKKYVSEDFLGKSAFYLASLKFITSNYEFKDSTKNLNKSKAMFSLTDRYFRYCAYRRRKFFDSKIWPLVISVAASVITSIITSLISMQLLK